MTAEVAEPVRGDPHALGFADLTSIAAKAASAAALAAAAAAVAAAASQQANRDIAVAGTLGALGANVQNLTTMVGDHGEVMLEMRDLARKTNGRVTAVEKTLVAQDIEIGIVKKARMDNAAVTEFLASFKGKLAVIAIAAGGLASLAAGIRALIP